MRFGGRGVRETGFPYPYLPGAASRLTGAKGRARSCQPCPSGRSSDAGGGRCSRLMFRECVGVSRRRAQRTYSFERRAFSPPTLARPHNVANTSSQAGVRGDGSIKGSDLGFNKAFGQQFDRPLNRVAVSGNSLGRKSQESDAPARLAAKRR